MSKFQLGEKEAASTLIEQVKQRTRDTNEALSDEDAEFLKEAEELLGLTPKPEDPK